MLLRIALQFRLPMVCSWKQLRISILCTMPLYEIEFGWGKQEWVTIPEMNSEVFLLDTKCGQV